LEDANIVFPIIIKPTIKETFFKKFRKKAIEVHSMDELRLKLSEITKIVALDQLLIQEIIPGPSSCQYSYVVFFKNGLPLVDLTARRTRQHPMDYGRASTFVEIVNIPELRETAVVLLKALDYNGVCEVEFKQDPRDGSFKLLEINARFWGWHSLTQGTGKNWPYLLYCDIYNLPYSDSGKSEKQKKQWLRITTDLPIAINEIRHHRLSPKDFMKQYFSRQTVHVTFSLNDLLPFFWELILIPYLWIKRGF
jgi:predicted ATP-grasp superfamily ATP-dependent carboligase